MRSQVLLLAGASAVVASTSFADSLFKRQAEIGEQCAAALGNAAELVSEMPELPTDPKFLEFLGTQDMAAPANECEIPSVTGDAEQAKVYSSWMSEMTSFVQEHGKELQTFLSACSEDPFVSSMIAEMSLPIDAATVCESYSFGGAAQPTGNASESGSAPAATATTTTTSPAETSGAAEESDAASSSAASSSEEPAGAPRQTGMAVAAMAVAGFAIAGVY